MSQKAFRDVFINHLLQRLSRILWNTSCSKSGSLNTANSHHCPEIVSEARLQQENTAAVEMLTFVLLIKRKIAKPDT